MAWFDDKKVNSRWDEAIAFLRKDRKMRKVIDRVGPCTLKPYRHYFSALTESIFSQQLNVKVADTLFRRFLDLFPRRNLTPARTIEILTGAVEEETLRFVGLSKQKRSYVLDLARHFADGRIPMRKLPKMTDDEVVEALTPVKGIGTWTAEMFLIFELNRPDVWPVDDLGLQESYKRVYGLEIRPKPKELIPLGEKFRPWRSIATWYLWRSAAPKPSSN